MDGPIYVFISRSELDEIKKTLRQLQGASQTDAVANVHEEASKWPLGCAAVVLGLTLLLTWCLRESNLFIYFFIGGVVMIQMCIDIYTGPSKPIWSASFRLLALIGWATQQLLQSQR